MENVLVVVDVQNDFVNGSLGTPEATYIVPNIVDKIQRWDGYIFATLDTHDEYYLDTLEGKRLPIPHCIYGTEGYKVNKHVAEALTNNKGFNENRVCRKTTFGAYDLPDVIRRESFVECAAKIEVIGLCTDICVISNALLLKAHFPDVEIVVDSNCCAGTSPEMHQKALDVMRSCQIEVI